MRSTVILLLFAVGTAGCETRGDETSSMPPIDLGEDVVTPHPRATLVRGQNCVYCATMQVAWANFPAGRRDALNEHGDANALALLNRSSIGEEVLPPNSYFCTSGSGGAVVDDIREQASERFPGLELDLPQHLTEALYLSYTLLKHDLPFETSFERFDRAPHNFPLEFVSDKQKARVASFGLIMSAGDYEMAKQVRIVDYRSDDDFVIVLNPKSADDEILLAKIPRPATLQDAIYEASDRMKNPRIVRFGPQLQDGEALITPVLELRTDHSFQSLTEGTLTEARQRIAMRLDETGANIVSDAWVSGFFSDEEEEKKKTVPRQFILNRPFLLWLRYKDADHPYFAMWVENTDFMELVED